MNKQKARIVGVAGIAALALVAALTACSGSAGGGTATVKPGSDNYLTQLKDKADQEGAVTVYASAGESQIQKIADAFMKDYPDIKVSYFRAAGSSLLNRYSSEAESGSVSADVFLPAVEPDFIEKHKDWFATITDKKIPAAKGWPSEFRTKYQVQVAIEPVLLGYNKKKVKNPPKTWEDVLAPEYKGKVMLTDPRSSPGYMSWYHIMQKKFGDDFLKKLGQQAGRYVDSGAVSAQQVAAGGYELAFPIYPSHTVELEASGAPIGVVTDLNPTQGLTTSVAISKDAPHPAAAKLFANWMIGPKGHDVLCAGVYSAVGKGDSKCKPVPSHYTPAVYDISKADQTKILDLLGLK